MKLIYSLFIKCCSGSRFDVPHCVFFIYTAGMEDKANGSVDTKRYPLWFLWNSNCYVLIVIDWMCSSSLVVVCKWRIMMDLSPVTLQPGGERSAARPRQLGGRRRRQLLQSNRVWGAGHGFSGSGRSAKTNWKESWNTFVTTASLNDNCLFPAKDARQV